MKTTPAQLIDRIGPPLAPVYEVDRLLAVGGMAVVFIARDVKHDRRVALKVLSPELTATVGAARFVREIRFAARMTHPHILPVLDSGEVDKLPYYVMPLIEGDSLRDRLDRERTLTLADAVRLTGEVADALAYAHAAGIVHRDIKPENILLVSGHPLVADFGIARAITAAADDDNRSGVTGIGVTIGTPAYMSPEQAAGEEHIDGRSDIYSLASMLFEMLTGTTPFADRSPLAMISRRFTMPAPRVRTLAPSVPPEIDEIIAVALEMKRDLRQDDVLTFSRALTNVVRGTSGGSPSLITIIPTPRATPARTTAVTDAAMPSVAVLPFANLSADPDNEFFSDGITEEIIGAIGRRRTIRVAARTSSFAFKGKHDDIRAIAEQLGVATILDGSVRRSGNKVRVRAQLTDARSGIELWSDQLDRELNDIFALQDEIAYSIAAALHVALLSDVAQSPVVSVAGEVYESYLRGRFALNKRTEAEIDKAVAYFYDATDKDPEFALAFAGLGDALLVRGIYGADLPTDVMPRAREAANQALSIDPSLPEAYATLGAVRAVFDWDWRGAEDAFVRAIALAPRYPTAHQWYATTTLVPQRRFDEARRAIDRARTLDPLSLIVRATSGVVRIISGDFPAAVAELEQALALDPSFAMAHYFKGSALREMGEFDIARESFETAISLTRGGTPEMLGGLAQTFARAGQAAEASRLRDRLVELAGERHVSGTVIAMVEACLGNTDAAMQQLERAVTERDSDLVYIGNRSSYASLHADPRFQSLLRRLGL